MRCLSASNTTSPEVDNWQALHGITELLPV